MTPSPEGLFDRSTLARIGITSLNLLLPGLGLIRLGQARHGASIAAIYGLLIWLMAGLAMAASFGSFAMAALIVLWFWLVALILLLASLVLTWRHSRCERDRHWWSRWYALLLWAILGEVSALAGSAFMHRSYKPFYVAAESMMPTLVRNEKVTADMRWRTAEIGRIVLIRDADGAIRIDRIVATGGQTFEMRDGVPIVDGRAASQRPVGEIPAPENPPSYETGRVIQEHLPGETGSHQIMLVEEGAPRNVPPIRVPRGHLYLLGDNRDFSADSRVGPELNGLGIAPVSAMVGRPFYIIWSRDRGRIGQPADH